MMVVCQRILTCFFGTLIQSPRLKVPVFLLQYSQTLHHAAHSIILENSFGPDIAVLIEEVQNLYRGILSHMHGIRSSVLGSIQRE